MDIFGTPPQYLEGLLGGQEVERLRKQSIGTGLLSAIIGGLQAAPMYRTQGLAPILGQALQSGMQGAQNVYGNAVQDYQTQQKIAEMQRQKEQQRLRDEAIAGLSPEQQALARIDPNSLGTLLAARLKTPEGPYGKVDVKDYEPSSVKAFNDNFNKTGKYDYTLLVPIAKANKDTVLGATEFVTARALFGPETPNDVNKWSPQQYSVWEQYKNAPTQAEAARIANEARNTQWNTGASGPVPSPRTAMLPSPNSWLTGALNQPSTIQEAPRSVLFGNAPQQAPRQAPTIAPTAPTAPSVPSAAPTEKWVPIIDQVTPKERQEMLIARPQEERKLKSTLGKFEDLDNTVNRLLSNPRGLAAVTGIQGAFPSIPGRKSSKAQTDLDSLKERIGLQAVNEMRELSKTGGAIGNITEREWPMLQSALGNLKQAQSYEDMVNSLKEVQGVMARMKAAAYGQFYSTYGNPGYGAGEQIAPANQLSPEDRSILRKYVPGY